MKVAEISFSSAFLFIFFAMMGNSPTPVSFQHIPNKIVDVLIIQLAIARYTSSSLISKKCAFNFSSLDRKN